MKIAIATDHNGVEEKKVIIQSLKNRGIEIIDCSINNNPIDDYPDFAIGLCRKIVDKSADLGILMCGTGIGMSIAANKVKGIRCAKVSNLEVGNMNYSIMDAHIYVNQIDGIKKQLNNYNLMIDYEKFIEGKDILFLERNLNLLKEISLSY